MCRVCVYVCKYLCAKVCTRLGSDKFYVYITCSRHFNVSLGLYQRRLNNLLSALIMILQSRLFENEFLAEVSYASLGRKSE